MVIHGMSITEEKSENTTRLVKSNHMIPETTTHAPKPRRLTKGKEKGKSRDANIQRQNWLRMQYENKKKYNILRFY